MQLVYKVIRYWVIFISQIDACTRTYVHNPNNNIIWEMYKVGLLHIKLSPRKKTFRHEYMQTIHP